MRLRPHAVAAAAALAVVVLAGCGGAGAERVADDAGTAPVGQDEAPRPSTPEEVEDAGEEGFPVLDETGDVRGTLTQAELDAQDERVDADLRVAGTGDVEITLAYQALEAIEVRDGDELVGYWTSHFVPVEEYPEVREAAQAVVAGDDA